jgi:hypothetical protein
MITVIDEEKHPSGWLGLLVILGGGDNEGFVS